MTGTGRRAFLGQTNHGSGSRSYHLSAAPPLSCVQQCGNSILVPCTATIESSNSSARKTCSLQAEKARRVYTKSESRAATNLWPLTSCDSSCRRFPRTNCIFKRQKQAIYMKRSSAVGLLYLVQTICVPIYRLRSTKGRANHEPP